MKRLETASTDETRESGKRLGESLQAGDIVALTGPLGVGKTVFTKGVAESLGVQASVTSPTYTLISEYTGRMPLYHMDLYRLGSPEEFVWLGIDEMLNGRGVTVIEWGERAGDELPERTICVQIELTDNATRIITITHPQEDTC